VEARGAFMSHALPRQPYVRESNEELGLIQRQLVTCRWWVFMHGEIGGQNLYGFTAC